MFDNTYELKNLWDNKSAQLRSRFDRSNGSRETSPQNAVSDSTFLGPILWDDALTISDLEHIDLGEFNPSVLECNMSASSSPSTAVFGDFVKDVMDISCTDAGPWGSDAKLTAYEQSPSPTESEKVPKTKTRVPVDQKNEKYWTRRMKNNAAAKRSRDARRMMESQVYMKATMLETENEQLKLELNRLREENKILRRLSESRSSSLSSPALETEFVRYSSDIESQPSLNLHSAQSHRSVYWQESS